MADLILGHEPVAALEWEPYCCQVLRERAAEGWFPHLQVFEGDVRLFDPSEYKGRVDIINAGFPCQDISLAGNRAGVGEGTRSGLYREVLRIADVVRPRYLFLENVSAILHNGLGTVLGDMAARGYDARWCCLRASEVGANHRRDRWWLLANSMPSRERRKQREEETEGDALAYPGEKRLQTEKEIREMGGERFGFDGDGKSNKDVPIPTSKRLEMERETAWERADGFRQGCWWETEPDLGRVAYGVASRVDRLKALGNGQVPLQAATAFKILMGGLNA